MARSRKAPIKISFDHGFDGGVNLTITISGKLDSRKIREEFQRSPGGTLRFYQDEGVPSRIGQRPSEAIWWYDPEDLCEDDTVYIVNRMLRVAEKHQVPVEVEWETPMGQWVLEKIWKWGGRGQRAKEGGRVVPIHSVKNLKRVEQTLEEMGWGPNDWAFAGAASGLDGPSLTFVRANQRGHYPIPFHLHKVLRLPPIQTYEEAQDLADELNQLRGMAEDRVEAIMGSSMFGSQANRDGEEIKVLKVEPVRQGFKMHLIVRAKSRGRVYDPREIEKVLVTLSGPREELQGRKASEVALEAAKRVRWSSWRVRLIRGPWIGNRGMPTAVYEVE